MDVQDFVRLKRIMMGGSQERGSAAWLCHEKLLSYCGVKCSKESVKEKMRSIERIS